MAESVAKLFDLAGKVAIVTGSRRGIGFGIALRLFEAGASVMLSGRAPELASAMASGREGRTRYFSGDLAADGSADALVKATLDAFGRLDILVNNAGVQPGKPLLEITGAGWDSVIAGNLRSTFLCTQAAARAMQAQKSGGAIVNIASVRAARPGMGMAHYSSAKAAIVALTRASAAELGASGIRVNAVLPGLVNRPGLDKEWPEGIERYKSAAPLGRIGEPGDVADACLFLASDAARWITGVDLLVDGGVALMR
ncbi:MAG: glucose 1-dehydrogenase [Alphaproteobacteria bacterium]|nr:glucose 1-dehydrogenase [Alphaproteobacteria bacterium]